MLWYFRQYKTLFGDDDGDSKQKSVTQKIGKWELIKGRERLKFSKKGDIKGLE